MLLPDHAGSLRVSQNVSHDPAQVTPMGFRGLGQERVAGGLVDQSVEGLIVTDQVGDVVCCDRVTTVSQDGLASLFELFRVTALTDAPGGSPRGQTVECGANVVVIAHQPEIETGDALTALADILNHPVGPEQSKSLLDGMTRYTELGGKLLLHKMCAGSESAVADVIQYRLVDPTAEVRNGL